MKMHECEKQFADTLDKQNRKWEFPVKDFKLVGKRSYRPDFFLPDEDIYIEVVGTRQAYHFNKAKYELFCKLYPDKKLLILNSSGEDYRSTIYNKKKKHEPKNEDKFALRIPDSLYSKIRKISYETRVSINKIILEAIKEYLKEGK